MRNFPKNLFSTLVLVLVLSSCGNQEQPKKNSNYRTITGEAQGTTYRITLDDSTGVLFSKIQSDSIFNAIDQSLSVWVPSSIISEFNASDSIAIDDPHFLTVYFRGEEINALSDGAFEPMIMPLVKSWGFGPDGAKAKGDYDIDSLLSLVHEPVLATPIDNGRVEEESNGFHFVKTPGQSLDVNGIAQGYTVDVIANHLVGLGIVNYMVEVGGEVQTQGRNAEGAIWTIGIDKPLDNTQERALQAIAHIDGKAIATSGSYRKFYEVNGKRYSHTIDATTGKPVDHQLLSATVLAPNCTNADAFATVFMVKGVAGTKEFLSAHPKLGLEVYLIYSDAQGALQTYMSPGMAAIIENL